jgi:hypothetical protein
MLDEPPRCQDRVVVADLNAQDRVARSDVGLRECGEIRFWARVPEVPPCSLEA